MLSERKLMAPNKVLICVLVLWSLCEFANCLSQSCGAGGDCENENFLDPSFLLYKDPEHPDKFTQLYMHEDGIKLAQPFSDGSWKVLIHGFINDRNSLFPKNVRHAYLERCRRTNDTYNILVVDWGRGACASLTNSKRYLYNYAIHNVDHVSTKLSQFLAFLHEHQKYTFLNVSENLHIIGFSLGFHIASQTGLQLYEKLGVRVRRLTGLDPAGPALWAWRFVHDLTAPHRDLNWKDAQFVDIYHSSQAFGTFEEMGDVDFYINKGDSQPPCVPKPFNYIFKDIIQICSHKYATVLFAKSINDQSMRGCANMCGFSCNRECNATAIFGESVELTTVGTFYIKTLADHASFSHYVKDWWKSGITELKQWWNVLC